MHCRFADLAAVMRFDSRVDLPIEFVGMFGQVAAHTVMLLDGVWPD